ncbi:MAG: hypothetical protein RI556_13145, partial [Hydrogenovibrio sp.]|uniref:hypothetical protein n=1 Tax=Hydrogenovibrio sp. TaxID=2065821 RepID=UPI0028700A51
MNSVIQISNPILTSQHPSVLEAFSTESDFAWSNRLIERLAHNLEYLIGLDPQRDHVTFILGHGECPTNHQALVAWLYEQLDETP